MTTVLLWSDTADRSVLDGLMADRVIVAEHCSGPSAREALLRSFAEARGAGGSTSRPRSPGDSGRRTTRRVADRQGAAGGSDLGQGVVLVGVRRGATAAVSLLLHQRRLGLSLGHVICLETSWGALDPISGRPLPPPGPIVPPTRIDLVGDDPATRDRARAWARLDWDVHQHPASTCVASILGH